jgi:histidine ammonia-lyase
VPTSGMQEDHVSMGWNAARQLRRVVLNAQRVIAVELVASARALELRAPLQPSPATAAVVAALRAAGAPGPGPDRPLEPELHLATQFIAADGVLIAAESVVGPLA